MYGRCRARLPCHQTQALNMAWRRSRVYLHLPQGHEVSMLVQVHAAGAIADPFRSRGVRAGGVCWHSGTAGGNSAPLPHAPAGPACPAGAVSQ